MMKKLLFLFLGAILPMIASADDSGTCGDNLTWTYVEATHTLTISGEGGIPYYWYPSYAPWYSYRNDMTKAIIEDGVTSIGGGAFKDCTGLASITIPNSVTSIGGDAFSDCYFHIDNFINNSALSNSNYWSATIVDEETTDGVLIKDNIVVYCRPWATSVTIPNSVTSIGAGAFSGFSSLTSITIGNSVTSIGDYAFHNCSGLTSITIGNSVTSIGDYAFCECSGLTSITIGNSVTSIGESAFLECSGLTSIKIPNSLTSIGDHAFGDCSGLTSITIGNSVTSIGDYAFHNCSGLTSITIGNSVTSIGESAFFGCSALSSITIPNSLTSIGEYAFSGCSSLTSIIVENGNTTYDSRDNCNAIIRKLDNSLVVGCKNTIVPYSVTSIGDHAFQGCSGFTSITIPNSVTSIGSGAFAGCRDLTSITIGNSVTSIESTAFNECSGLTSITFHCNEIKSWFSRYKSIKDVIIGDEVTGIGGDAFSGCSGLNFITMGNRVTSIGYQAFYGCSGLTSITIPYSVTSIGNSAFYNCNGLTSITIPNSVTSIGNSAFEGCNGLTSITIPNSVTSIGANTFNGCDNITTVISEITEPFNCGNSSVFSTNTYRKGTLYIPEGTKDLYTRFDGWREFLKIEEVGGEPQLFHLTFVVNNEKIEEQDKEAGAAITLPTTTDGEGNDIVWYTYPETMPAHDLVVYGYAVKPEPTKYTLAYVLEGEAYKSIGLEEGTAVTKETAPYKEGYTFSGWQDEPTTMPGNDVTVSGSFTINSYSLTFIVDNNELSKQSVEYGVAITTPATTDDEGNDIVWYTYPETMPAHDLLVYGYAVKPEPTKYTLAYLLDGEPYKSTELVEGAAIAKETEPYKEGYTFTGWQNEPATMPGNDVTVNGSFTINSYNLAFIVDNNELAKQSVEYGTAITVPATTNDEGNDIVWYTYPETMPAHDLVVYGYAVKPEPAKYTLAYLLDGEPYKNIELVEGAAIAKETEPAKEGYTFSGWQNEPTTMPDNNVTVSGSFVINSYRLSFIAENRELSAQNVEYGSRITAPQTDAEGNSITWYTYPLTMPAHDLVVYGLVVKQPEPEVFVWLTMKDGQGTTRIKVKQGAEQVLTIMPEEGWKLLAVTIDETDVTAQVGQDGSFTTSAIMQDATIVVVYEQEVPSGAASARRSQANVKVVDDGVVISNAEPDARCAVYAANGQQVVSTVIDGGSRKITLQKGQVYVLTLGSRTLKFAL